MLAQDHKVNARSRHSVALMVHQSVSEHKHGTQPFFSTLQPLQPQFSVEQLLLRYLGPVTASGFLLLLPTQA